MKAKITLDSYSIEINGVKHSGFVKESEWEGFAKFKNEQGSVIVFYRNDGVMGIFDQIFNTDLDNKEYEIITTSTSFAKEA